MENTKKVTKRVRFEEIKGIVEEMGRTDLVEFVNHELELLDKKANSKTLTSSQKENAEIKKTIVARLVELGRSVTISELQKEEEFANYSNQKLSALLKQLVDSNEVVRTTDKKKAFFGAIND